MWKSLPIVLVAGLSWGCEPQQSPAPEANLAPTPAPAAVPYRPVTNVLHTMEWILDPAVDVIWESAGYIITAEGERDLSPTTDAGWERVRNSAALVAEVGNLLMMPGRSAGGDWLGYSQRLTRSGERAMATAVARDKDALFEAGGEIYRACQACHEQYLVRIEEARNAQ